MTVALVPTYEVLQPREVPLGGTRQVLVRRTLPNRTLRTVGAWCFVDHYGPHDVSGAGSSAGMDVPPHPHTGLQTVSWLLEGEVEHRDSVGSHATIRPGELNLMTSGRGIAHSEVSVPGGSTLHGVQLWVALPDDVRAQDPHFEHHAELPVIEDGGLRTTVIMGELGGAASTAQTYSPLMGAHIRLAAGADGTLPLEPGFEHAALLLTGAAVVDGHALEPGALSYLGGGRRELRLSADDASEVLLLGGEPFEEELLMWWNFVGRSDEDIRADRADWEAGRRFGTVTGYPGDPLPAPAAPTTRLRPRPGRPATGATS